MFILDFIVFLVFCLMLDDLELLLDESVISLHRLIKSMPEFVGGYSSVWVSPHRRLAFGFCFVGSLFERGLFRSSEKFFYLMKGFIS